jgi:hypothetical protein
VADCHAHAHTYPHALAVAHLDTAAHPHADHHPHGLADRHADALPAADRYTHTHAHPYPGADPHATARLHADVRPHTNTFVHIYLDADSHTIAYTYPSSHGKALACAHRRPGYRWSTGHGYAHCHSEPQSIAYPYPNGALHTDAQPDDDAHPIA